MSVRLFVGNLPYQATETDVRQHFSAVADPLSVAVPVDRETGRPRGFAFVEFADATQAEAAIRRFNGEPFMGRPLAVNEARPREERPPARRPSAPGFPPPRPASTGPDDPDTSGGGTRSARSSARREKDAYGVRRDRGDRGDRGPRGPIRERFTGRVYSVDDDSDEAPLDFDNVATSTDDGKEDDEEPSE